MRPVAAYCLFCLILSSWIGSCWRCDEATYCLRLLHRMNTREASIAQRLERSLTKTRLVKIVDSAGSALRGYLYSGDAVFSVEMEGDTVHFLLLDDSKAISYEREYQTRGNSSEKDTLLVTLSDFFKIFLFPTTILSTGISPESPGCLYSSTGSYSSPIVTVPEPPPDCVS